MESAKAVRIDKWLWAVRIFKTRSQATDACRSGHVKIGGHNVKPAHDVKLGEVITVTLGPMTRTVRVVGLLGNRVGAKLVPESMEDLTPPEEYQKQREPDFRPLWVRPKGAGRPTKKERRTFDEFTATSSDA
jgi:ribosome-associated heat shock protein Hsp15